MLRSSRSKESGGGSSQTTTVPTGTIFYHSSNANLTTPLNPPFFLTDMPTEGYGSKVFSIQTTGPIKLLDLNSVVAVDALYQAITDAEAKAALVRKVGAKIEGGTVVSIEKPKTASSDDKLVLAELTKVRASLGNVAGWRMKTGFVEFMLVDTSALGAPTRVKL